MKKRRTVGFVITPDAIKDRVIALDNAIATLDAAILESTAKRLDAAWRNEWGAFRTRWAIERDSYASWSSRLFATYAMPRIEAFEANYRWWARSFQDRSGKRAPIAPRADSENLLSALVPEWVWWAGVGLGAFWIVASQARKGVTGG